MTDPFDNNPYNPPRAHVVDISERGNVEMEFAVPGRRVDAARGISWIGDGWGLFKKSPWMWLAALLIVFAIQVVIGIVPILGDVAGILVGPFFLVAVLAFAHGQASGGAAELNQLLAGFKNQKIGSLLQLGLLLLALSLVIIGVLVGLALALYGGAIFSMPIDDPEMLAGFLDGKVLIILLFVLVAIVLSFLVGAAYWFAPGLIFFCGLGPIEAMKKSFSACFRNWLPMLVYGIFSMLVLFAGVLALGVGLLVAVPVLMVSYYSSFCDIFCQNKEN